jgi:hypothetical protein
MLLIPTLFAGVIPLCFQVADQIPWANPGHLYTLFAIAYGVFPVLYLIFHFLYVTQVEKEKTSPDKEKSPSKQDTSPERTALEHSLGWWSDIGFGWKAAAYLIGSGALLVAFLHLLSHDVGAIFGSIGILLLGAGIVVFAIRKRTEGVSRMRGRIRPFPLVTLAVGAATTIALLAAPAQRLQGSDSDSKRTSEFVLKDVSRSVSNGSPKSSGDAKTSFETVIPAPYTRYTQAFTSKVREVEAEKQRVDRAKKSRAKVVDLLRQRQLMKDVELAELSRTKKDAGAHKDTLAQSCQKVIEAYGLVSVESESDSGIQKLCNSTGDRGVAIELSFQNALLGVANDEILVAHAAYEQERKSLTDELLGYFRYKRLVVLGWLVFAGGLLLAVYLANGCRLRAVAKEGSKMSRTRIQQENARRGRERQTYHLGFALVILLALPLIPEAKESNVNVFSPLTSGVADWFLPRAAIDHIFVQRTGWDDTNKTMAQRSKLVEEGLRDLNETAHALKTSIENFQTSLLKDGSVPVKDENVSAAMGTLQGTVGSLGDDARKTWETQSKTLDNLDSLQKDIKGKVQASISTLDTLFGIEEVPGLDPGEPTLPDSTLSPTTSRSIPR